MGTPAVLLRLILGCGRSPRRTSLPHILAWIAMDWRDPILYIQ